MNKRGFTLVELLVVIVILGLITFLGFPALIRVMDSNTSREFELYGESMIAGAKLYMLKEGYDIRQSSQVTSLRNGEYTIDLDTLVNGEYVSKYNPTKKGVKCYSAKKSDPSMRSGVRVKLDESTNTYSYTYQLFCEKNKKDYEYLYE